MYLKQCFLQMNRFDLVDKLDMNNLSLFAPEFKLIDPNNLLSSITKSLKDRGLLSPEAP